MKKKILNIALALAVAIAGFTSFNMEANAETEKVEWTVTYNGKSFDSTYSADKAKLTNAMPGDTIEFIVDYVNGTSENADFYMSADIIKSLEEGADATGGAYSYKIISSESAEPIFDSETVGGDATDVIGLDQVDSGEGAYFALGTLAAGDSGKVTISIALDGNSQNNAYMATLAQLEIKFGAEPSSEAVQDIIKEETVTKTETKVNTVTEHGSGTIVKRVTNTVGGGTPVVIINDDAVPLDGGTAISGANPRTGDSIIPLVACGTALLIGLLLIVWYFRMTKEQKEEVA